MPTKRFFILLLIVFCAGFWWAGGYQLTPHLPTMKINTNETNTMLNSLKRIVFLKSAVSENTHTKNWVKLQDIPLTFQQAVIAVEDNRFYRHYGFDIEAIFRAVLVNLQKGEIIEGGSTITQQLVKNMFLSNKQTINRKIEEFILSIDMELNYSKEEIFEMYLNTIYFGSGAYGIHDASLLYFGKQPKDLNLAECALLAGIPNAPSVYSPYENFSAAKMRQAVVLSVMVRQGYIGPALSNQAKEMPLHIIKR